MKTYSRSHVSDAVLLLNFKTRVVQDCTATAEMLADLAEIDARKLYLPAAYPSMFAYCVGEFHFSEDVAFKRIRVARMARRFPAIFDAIAEGRLHLTAVVMLKPHLTRENADELLAAATHRTKSEIERLLAERFPQPDVVTRIQAIAPTMAMLPTDQLVPEPVQTSVNRPVQEPVEASTERLVLEPVQARPKVTALAPQRFALQATIGQETHDLLERAQELLSHQIPSGDVAEVLHRALRTLVTQLEKRKFATTNKPRSSRRRANAGGRYIPAGVKHSVWKRDGGRCTFVSDDGKRCPARHFLEFDHIDEVARGGRASVDRIRLRCRAHNQYTAECTFGTAFMENKRVASARAQAVAAEKAHAGEVAERAELDVIPWLRRLGFRADEARRAAELCENIPDATLEERVRVALSYFHPRGQATKSLGTAA